MKIEAFGNSLEEARRRLSEKLKEVKTALPQFVYEKGVRRPPDLLHEKVVFDRTKTITREGSTVEDALHLLELQRRVDGIPTEASSVSTETQPSGELRTQSVEAFTEDEARKLLRDAHGEQIYIRSVTVEAEGRKGFLGLGKKTPSRFALTFQTPAVATLTYKYAHVLGFVRQDRESAFCAVCPMLIREDDIKKVLDGVEETYLPSICDGCYAWVCYWCARHLLAPAIVPTEHADKIRRYLRVVGDRVKHLECEGYLRSFRALALEWKRTPH